MADEEHHGLGFPKDRVNEKDGMWVDSVDKDVAAVLEELRGKWKWFRLLGEKWTEWKRYLRSRARPKAETQKPTRM